jgi:hypothetical protein
MTRTAPGKITEPPDEDTTYGHGTTDTEPTAPAAPPTAPDPAPAAPSIALRRIEMRRILVPIVGTAPLITHRWSEKAKRQMLDAMQGIKNPKENKDPDKEYEESIYHTDDGRYGFPTLGFKAATVGGARLYKKNSLPMTAVRQVLRFTGVYSNDKTPIMVTPIEGEPAMREDYVTVGIGGRDLRYRAQFTDWHAVLDVQFVPTMLDEGSVLNLIEAGGMSVGVGEWRPERDGLNGTYEIDTSKEILRY